LLQTSRALRDPIMAATVNVPEGEKSDPPGTAPAGAAPVRAEPVSSELPVERWQRGSVARTTDLVAEEVPVALVYHDVPHVVMLATPADLEDYAVGFTLSEALVARPDEIRGVTVTRGAASVDVHLTVAWERFTELLQRRRNLTGRTGCGLCGAETAADAIRETGAVPAGVPVTVDQLHAAIEQLAPLQVINARTGSVHAAAWVVPGEGIKLVREDVGRHNALDKAIGALARAGADFGSGFMLMTSRASYELVQKCATVGIPLLVAMSAPTAFAVRLAQRAGITLVAFARHDRHVVYAHPQRLK
jgi:FdhD protein